VKIIDFRIKVPVRDTEDEPGGVMPSEYDRYGEIYGVTGSVSATTGELLDDLREAGLAPSVLQAEREYGDPAHWNDRTSRIVAENPGAFACGFAQVDPRKPMEAIDELERAYHDLGLRGAIFEPAFLDISPTDPRCYPVYARCSQLGIPVGLHTGVNFSSHGPLLHERPVLIDQIACHFPKLTIIAHHGGWPWPTEMAAIAWKHTNVYLEFGAIAPKYMAANGGWGDMVHFMDTVLHEKVLFGTDWPMLRYDRVLEEVEQLGLRQRSLEAYLGGNAERLLSRVLSAAV
jgi:predicted TIM-barrel fold metal-dependent hydrolase